jgi:zinc protease
MTGISHMLEHMMFKGTDNYGTGEFSKIIARNGGDDNAFTSKDLISAFFIKGNQIKTLSHFGIWIVFYA